MEKKDFTPREERRIKFAEAGILFVLILGIAVFVGVKMTGDAGRQTAATATVTVPAPPGEATTDDVTTADAARGEADIVADAAETAVASTAEPEPESEPEAEPEPEPIVVTYAMAEQAYLDRDYDEAAELFGRYTAEHRDNAWGFYMLGLSEWKADDAEAADGAFAEALALDPTHVKSLVNDGRVLLELGRADAAEAQVAAALDRDPANADAHRVMGRIRDVQGRADEAIASYEAALGLDGNDAWSLNNLGLVLIGQERFAEALAPLAKAALLRGDLACVQNNLGVALERTGHYGAAADAYARALAADAAYAKAEVSRERVAALTEAPGTEAIDLEVLAAAFSVGSEAAAAEAGTEPQPVDMDVAAAVAAAEDGEVAGPAATSASDKRQNGPQER